MPRRLWILHNALGHAISALHALRLDVNHESEHQHTPGTFLGEWFHRLVAESERQVPEQRTLQCYSAFLDIGTVNESWVSRSGCSYMTGRLPSKM